MLVRWDPFAEMSRLHDQLFGGSPMASMPAELRVDIREEDNAYVLDAEVPGLAADDIKLNIEKNVLTIHGERKSEEEETSKRYRRVERRYGSFSRSFALPETVDAEAIEAKLADGVLTLTLPKRERPTPRSIDIKA